MIFGMERNSTDLLSDSAVPFKLIYPLQKKTQDSRNPGKLLLYLAEARLIDLQYLLGISGE